MTKSDFPGAPKMLTPAEQAEAVGKLVAKQRRFKAHGGTRCHCGGLIYPTPAGPRVTCTHGPGEPLKFPEIAAIWAVWDSEDMP